MSDCSSRQKVLDALNFKSGEIPKDLGAMASTGISAFAYPKLVKELGLPFRKPKVYDIFQMLSLVDMDVLDALGCDVVSVVNGVTNAFEEPDKWEDFDFNGRLDAKVRDRTIFEIMEDDSIYCSSLEARMPISSTVFDVEHGGHALVLSNDFPKLDIADYERRLACSFPKLSEIEMYADLCSRVRQSTDKAVMFTGPINAGISIGETLLGGIGVFPMLCLLEPEYVKELHALITEYSLRKIDAILPKIKDNIDILMFSADDWGTQNALIAPPKVYETLFLPYLKRLIARIKQIAPDVKVFLHSCGNIIELIPLIIEAGYDVLNPVQWSTTGAGSYQRWKKLTYGKIALWGGGVDSQHTLPLGTLDEVVNEAKQASKVLSGGGGYVFNNIHNFLADTDPAKLIGMYGI